MSLRAIGSRLFNHGRTIVRSLYRRELNSNSTTIGEQQQQLKALKATEVVAPSQPTRYLALRSVGIHARRLFVDNVLNRVTNSLAAELRKKAARRMLFGDSGPFFALVGVSLASGTGILTKDDELEGICFEIRDAISKIKWNHSPQLDFDEITLKDLELDRPIAKGCSAVVYAAKLIDNNATREEDNNKQKTNEIQAKVEMNSENQTAEIHAEINDAISDYPFAVKMMFNYDVQSSAMLILRAMYRETVPARKYYNVSGLSDWEIMFSNRTTHLSQHPNIVEMYTVFADYVPQLTEALALYPAALPTRLNPDGVGHNMSLFMLMKRYNCSLQQYLSSVNPKPTIRTSILLLTQLLEGVVHMNMQGVAHRDLKSDNILLDLQQDDVSTPILVITDFGCCLADKSNGLQLPYNSMEIDKGGNTALMAPEIITQTPGTFTMLNYSKSDLWAVGSIAYEMFGLPNPFYESENCRKLRNVDYEEQDLPPLPDEVPVLLRMLITNMLARNPKKRLDPEIAANVCQLMLWAPSDWLKANAKLPSSAELLQWLLCLTTKVLCEGRFNFKGGRRTYPEYLLISSFLSRAKLAYIKNALTWIHQIIY